MTRTITLTGKQWTQFIAENADDPEAADAVATVASVLAAKRAEVAQIHRDETNINYVLLNGKLAITLTVPA